MSLLRYEEMAGNRQTQLYLSQAWKDTRSAYLKKVGGLCEECLKQGIIRPAEIVHHKIPLTEDNVMDLNISLSWNNLQALCRSCHADAHEEMYRKRSRKRYRVDRFGNVKIQDDHPPMQT